MLNIAAAVETATATETTAEPTVKVLGYGWAETTDAEAHARALTLARGCYQRALLDGREALSGSTLAGNAARYGYWYAQSRHNLLGRLRAAGIAVSERRAPHGKRVLVIG